MKMSFKKWIAPAAFGLFGLGLVPSAMADNPIIQTYYSPDPAPAVFGDTLAPIPVTTKVVPSLPCTAGVFPAPPIW